MFDVQSYGQTEPVPPEMQIILINSHSLYTLLLPHKTQNDEAKCGELETYHNLIPQRLHPFFLDLEIFCGSHGRCSLSTTEVNGIT
jgi:hypothetical protein